MPGTELAGLRATTRTHLANGRHGVRFTHGRSVLLRSALREDIFAQFTEISLPGLGFSALTLYFCLQEVWKERGLQLPARSEDGELLAGGFKCRRGDNCILEGWGLRAVCW